MNGEQAATICAYVASNWPHVKMPDETLTVWGLELAPLDFDLTLRVLREECASGSFPPPPMKLRDLVVQRSCPSTSWEELLAELLDAIASVGYASPEPEWSHPALATFVRHRGGWVTVCQSTPARDSLGPGGVGTFNTWQAQARDMLRPLIVASVRDARAEITSPDLEALDVTLARIGRGAD